MTTHNPKHANFGKNRVLLLKNGQILKFGEKSRVLTDENLSNLYNIDYIKFKEII